MTLDRRSGQWRRARFRNGVLRAKIRRTSDRIMKLVEPATLDVIVDSHDL